MQFWLNVRIERRRAAPVKNHQSIFDRPVKHPRKGHVRCTSILQSLLVHCRRIAITTTNIGMSTCKPSFHSSISFIEKKHVVISPPFVYGYRVESPFHYCGRLSDSVIISGTRLYRVKKPEHGNWDFFVSSGLKQLLRGSFIAPGKNINARKFVFTSARNSAEVKQRRKPAHGKRTTAESKKVDARSASIGMRIRNLLLQPSIGLFNSLAKGQPEYLIEDHRL